MNLKIRTFVIVTIVMLIVQGCGVYSLSGASTTAKTISIDLFFNNTDLGPANLSQTFTNKIKDYFQQNSKLTIVEDNGELHIEGIISQYGISPIAPVATSDPKAINTAALSRLTIAVKVTYEDATVPKNSFKDRQFSFYRDFDNTLTFTNLQEDLQNKIFEQIFIDIFNATIANW